MQITNRLMIIPQKNMQGSMGYKLWLKIYQIVKSKAISKIKNFYNK